MSAGPVHWKTPDGIAHPLHGSAPYALASDRVSLVTCLICVALMSKPEEADVLPWKKQSTPPPPQVVEEHEDCWIPTFVAWAEGESDCLDFGGAHVPERLLGLLDTLPKMA